MSMIIKTRHSYKEVCTLYTTAFNDDTQTMRQLLDQGAHVEGCDLNRTNSIPPLHIAAKYGKLNATQLLLAYEANVNAINCADGTTALHFAANPPMLTAHKSAAVIQVLLEGGADVAIRNQEGLTSLNVAIQGHNRKSAIEPFLSQIRGSRRTSIDA